MSALMFAGIRLLLERIDAGKARHRTGTNVCAQRLTLTTVRGVSII
jgi:hypothetical protein